MSIEFNFPSHRWCSSGGKVTFTPVVAMPVKKVGFRGWLHRILGRGEAIIPSPRIRRKSRRVTILNKGYLCPKCAETKLEFSVFAFLD